MSVRWSDWAPNRASRDITIGVAFGIALSISFTSISTYIERRRRIEREKAEGARDYIPRPIELRSDEIVDGVVGLIGNTPLVRINSLSEALGVDILGKAEFLNPGGSVKDRVALKTIIMPDDVAAEKERALLALGATVEKNLAKHRALEFGKTEMHTTDDSMVASTQGGPDKPRGFFADQFESPSNYQAHLQSTGPELWRQCSGRLDAFVSGAGTGGTIAGVGRYLKSQGVPTPPSHFGPPPSPHHPLDLHRPLTPSPITL
ncbi:cysteine synthase [Rhizoctonia solani]|uniref:Cysteine synthase n=1 Tax=Rhizoctonia solani TaxID=456999 RepID=A0A8H8NZV1_9AGAM|nr:cysteine synthase [Rhizoctonia solani]QRW21742.1 cysteine synthase [Rhizoctonia solani]